MDIVKEVLDYFIEKKALKISETMDAHKAFFISRRAAALIKEHDVWLLEPEHATLKSRVDSEFTAVQNFITQKIGTSASPGTLFASGAGALDPPPLDLTDLARQRTSDTATLQSVQTRIKDTTNLRILRGQWIIWRACAIQNDIWSEAPDGKTATIKDQILIEYLDRRLRIVERMHYNIAVAGPRAGGMGWPQWSGISTPKGPWKDGFRVRIIEYPRLPVGKDPADSIFVRALGGVSNVAPGSVTLPNDPHDKPGAVDNHAATVDQHWNWSPSKSRLEWRVGPKGMDVSPGRTDIWGNWDKFAWRLPPAIRDNWSPSLLCQFHINLMPVGGSTGAKAIDDLFNYVTLSREDFWNRSWLWCDQTIAACHLDALLFGLRRRLGKTAGDKIFNDLVDGINLPAGAQTPYVQLRPVIRGSLDPQEANQGKLMEHCVDETNCPDRHFQNLWIQDKDIQVGDHVIFWNHVLYSALSSGDWRLENALIMEVSSTPEGGIDSTSMKLQGHGTSIETYPNYQNSIASHLQEGLSRARQAIKNKLETSPKPLLANTKTIPYNGYQLVQWSPFGNIWDVTYSGKDKYKHNAWWVEIPLDITMWDTLDDAVKGLPNVIAYKTTSGFTEAPPKPMNRDSLTQPAVAPYNYSQVVYFPLFAPVVDPIAASGTTLEGWAAYIERKKGANPPVLTLLKPVMADGKYVRGIYWRPDRSVPIVRPKAKV